MKNLKAGKDLKAYKEKNIPENCPLCGRLMKNVETKNLCLDHDHKSGQVRGVLCRNCNGLEGKINNLCTRAGTWVPNSVYLKNVIEYWKKYEDKPTGIVHPSHGKKKKRRPATRRRG